jgi:hypothetical protein
MAMALADHRRDAFSADAANCAFEAELKTACAFNTLSQHRPFEFRSKIPVALAADATQCQVRFERTEALRHYVPAVRRRQNKAAIDALVHRCVV